MAMTTFADVEMLQSRLEETVAEWLRDHTDSEIKFGLDWSSKTQKSKRKMKITVEEIVPQLPGFDDASVERLRRYRDQRDRPPLDD